MYSAVASAVVPAVASATSTLRSGKFLDFTVGALPTIVSFSRASSGGRTNSAGAFELLGTDVARFDYSSGTALGLLLEGSRTNYIRNSGNSGAVVGTVGSGGALPTNMTYGSLGGLSLEVTEVTTRNGINGFGIRLSGTPSVSSLTLAWEPSGVISASSGQLWTASFYSILLAGSMANITSLNCRVHFDGSSTGTNVAYTPTSAIQRISSAATAPASTTSVRTQMTLALTIGLAIDITLWVGGTQCELGALSSYIPTSGSAATRAADLATIGDMGTVGFNASSGTVIAEFSLEALVTSQRIFEISNAGSTANRMLFTTNGSYGRVVITTGGALQADITVSGLNSSGTNKVGFSYGPSGFKCLLNGGSDSTGTGTIPTVSKMFLGADSSGTNSLWGWMKNVRFLPYETTEAQRKALTA